MLQKQKMSKEYFCKFREHFEKIIEDSIALADILQRAKW